MTNPLEALLTGRDWLLADGAMGTNLFALGLAGGVCGEQWNTAAPAKVESVHRDMVAAGADILLTNTFGANRYRLALHGLGERAVEINEAGAEIARGVADAAGRPVVVAGSMGPTGDILEPLGERTRAEAVDAFAEQAEGLRRGGADVAWIETMYAENELEAAILAAREAGLPFLATMTFDTAGRTMMGIRPRDVPGFAVCRAHPPLGSGRTAGWALPSSWIRSSGCTLPRAGRGDRREEQLRAPRDGRRLAGPLRRHSTDHGRVRLPGPRRRRAHHRRLLWNDTGAPRGDARSAGAAPAGRRAGSRGDRGAARPAGGHGRDRGRGRPRKRGCPSFAPPEAARLTAALGRGGGRNGPPFRAATAFPSLVQGVLRPAAGDVAVDVRRTPPGREVPARRAAAMRSSGSCR